MYVERDKAGAIITVYRRPQTGLVTEAVADDDAELVAFLNRATPAADAVTLPEVVGALDQIAKASNLSSADRTKLDALVAKLG